MRNVAITISALAGATMFSTPARAQDADGWYLSASGTVSLNHDARQFIFSVPTPVGYVDTVQSIQTGYGGQAAVGRKIGAVRIEAEAGYTHNHSDHYTALIPANGRIAGDNYQNAWRLMANGYVDFGHGPVQPFVGAGAGYSRVRIHSFTSPATFPNNPPSLLLNDKIGHFTFQVMGGAAVRLSSSLSLTAQYRYLSAGTLYGDDLSGHRISRRYADSNIDVGLRLRF